MGFIFTSYNIDDTWKGEGFPFGMNVNRVHVQLYIPFFFYDELITQLTQFYWTAWTQIHQQASAWSSKWEWHHRPSQNTPAGASKLWFQCGKKVFVLCFYIKRLLRIFPFIQKLASCTEKLLTLFFNVTHVWIFLFPWAVFSCMLTPTNFCSWEFMQQCGISESEIVVNCELKYWATILKWKNAQTFTEPKQHFVLVWSFIRVKTAQLHFVIKQCL